MPGRGRKHAATASLPVRRGGRSRAPWAVCLGLVLVVCGCVSSPPEEAGGGVYSPHRDEDGFFNPWRRFDRSFWEYVRWRLFARNPYDKSGEPVIPSVENDGAYLAQVDPSATVTWIGHASFAVHDRDDVFLTDPHFGDRSFFPKRYTEPGIPITSIPADAFAVISHNHYDHLDEGTIERLPPTVGYFVPLGMAEWFRERGRSDVTELDWWESARRDRFTITCLPAQHWSLRVGQPADTALWCSWLVDSGDHRYFFAGDTGYFPGFAEFGRRFTPIDVALLPIGAYAPRWLMEYQHMNPEDAYRAFADLRARYLVPMHWGTFDLTDEPLDLPPRELARVVRDRGGDETRVHVMAIGERWRVPRRESTMAARRSQEESTREDP